MWASASCDVSLYVLTFAAAHCAYPQRDGQAEFIWLAGYVPRWPPIKVITRPNI